MKSGTVDLSGSYWDAVASEPRASLWREYSDSLNSAIITDWLAGTCPKRVLKTDAYDETVAAGTAPVLLRHSPHVHVIDISAGAVAAAVRKYPVGGARSDVRWMPFGDGAFDAIVSLSTLDHFENVGDLDRALAEISRVLSPGGLLIVSLDNGANPVVRLRNGGLLPFWRRLRIVPYFVGATYDMADFNAALRRVNLIPDRTRTLLHIPRVAAVALCAMLGRFGGTRRFLFPVFRAFEGLAKMPGNSRTGYYIAVLARKAS